MSQIPCKKTETYSGRVFSFAVPTLLEIPEEIKKTDPFNIQKK